MKKPAKIEPDGNSMLLRASAKRLFESLMEQTTDRIYIKDKKSRFISCSQALADMHGFKNRHDLEGMTDFDLFTKEHAQQAYEDEQEILRTEKPIINKIEKETWEDKHITWVSSTKAPLYLKSGKLAGIIGISRDVTNEKIAQERLAKSEQRLREQNEVMRSDYESAQNVQSVMIPGRVPQIKHLEIAHLWKPMTLVGGDIINFPRNPSNRLLFFMGDVCGHGVTAAFYTVLIKYLTAHSAEVYNDDPRDFLDSVNKGITGRINNGFVTGLAGHFEARREDGSRNLIVSHAGHRQVLVYRKENYSVELIDLPNSTVMGIPGTTASKANTIDLHIGDRFFAFTDGIIEASDLEGNEFGNKRMMDRIKALAGKPIQETIDTLYEEVSAFTQSPNQQDDITILAFELT
ncbi:SpoIIE family protein phosphatase [Puniceicoccales bacterium CK1056]|uniref:SpoIIE family protein phosphatase n=1 Tax=Oceanipulchritudo coccoides TaxID=2706888 RepID=A0A6B2M402_9BACT|nr:PP2C family protein-serine/threonine phosphatase [Oceanipulchritudo coccoides]NDV63483.1 SpoIIE family protein phosphatase [Oceanipulchritudo coccoides]